jgi:DNA-3-methyladenine glycosylase
MKTDATYKSLPREFYLRDAREVARALLGQELVHESSSGVASGIIVETEAYLGSIDRASHAFGNRASSRTAIMYEEGGHAYVYLIYGMYWCLNITANVAGTPECVLIRALQPVTGLDLMRRRRHAEAGKSLANLTNGPGKLCLALGIDRAQYGEDFCGKVLFVRERQAVPNDGIGISSRVNIDYAVEAIHHQWRYFLKVNPFVSRPRKGVIETMAK